jgi:Family of unknown function (DUF5681)
MLVAIFNRMIGDEDANGSNEPGETAARGRAFVRGQSGNPGGRPAGARNRRTLAAAVLLDGEAEALTRKAVELALAGDPWTFSPRA